MKRLFIFDRKFLLAKSRQLLFILITNLFFLSNAKAVLDIEITQAVDGAMPVAVVPFAINGDILPEYDIAEIIRNDLHRSGEFAPIPVMEMRERPNDITNITTDYWRQKGIENLIVGTITPSKDNSNSDYVVTAQLIDLFSDKKPKLVFAKRYKVNPNLIRTLAHHISDLIYENITGTKGAFSTQIAYVTTEWLEGKPYRYRLQIADVDGFNPKPLLTSSEPVMSPSWSPDGKYIAYVSFENHRSEIYISNIKTGKRKKLTSYAGINGAPAWSQDGKKMAIVLSKDGYPKLFLLDLASGELNQLTSGWSIDTEPHWMPDGKSILFTSNRGGKPQIYRFYLDNKKIERVTWVGDYNARSSVTATGDKLVMIHRTENGFHIAVQDMATGGVKILTKTNLDESPTLSPNGKMIVYGTTVQNRRVLGAVSIDGRVKLQLPATDGEVQEPAWSPFLS